MQPFADRRSQELIAIVESSPWFMNALAAVASLNLASWCIGAGAVRNLVWDRLHGYQKSSALSDIDVGYFDEQNLNPVADRALQFDLQAKLPEVPWEVTNQAAVHLWFEDHFGYADRPFFLSKRRSPAGPSTPPLSEFPSTGKGDFESLRLGA